MGSYYFKNLLEGLQPRKMLEVSALDIFKEGNTNKRCAAGPWPRLALEAAFGFSAVTGEAPAGASGSFLKYPSY